MMSGRPVQDPPDGLMIALMLKAYPGYTASSLLAEDADLVDDLWQTEMAMRAVQKVLDRARR